MGFSLLSGVSPRPAVWGVRPVGSCGASLLFGTSSWPGPLPGWQWLLPSSPKPYVLGLGTASSCFVPTDEFSSFTEVASICSVLFAFHNEELPTYTVVKGALSHITSFRNATEIQPRHRNCAHVKCAVCMGWLCTWPCRAVTAADISIPHISSCAL